MDLIRAGLEWVRDPGGSTPADGLYLLLESGPRLLKVRTKNLLGRLCAEHVECERHAWAVAREMVAYLSEVEHATAVRMVCVGPRGS